MTISNSNGSSFYGARSARRATVKEFSKSEIANRIQNSNLVRLVDAYRSFGHKCASIDPLNMWHQSHDASLDPSTYGLDDPQAEYQLEGIVSMKGLSKATLAQIIKHLENVYCGHMAFEFMHITDDSLRRWFASQAETCIDTNFSKEEKYKFLELMARSETFDHYMMRECGHQKQFSLEGSESALVALQQVLEHSSKAGVLEVVMCLTHRCRMQIMMELLGVPKDSLFRKFQGLSEFPDEIPSHIIGDLVYNAQASVDLNLGGKHPLHVSVVPNPCHLELVNPVALGKVRAKQEDYLSLETDDYKVEDMVMSVQMHGDGGFTGQGVVTETFGLTNLPHFTTGGTVHIVLNNQVSVTTDSANGRSTTYSSDIGKMVEIPAIHVNGDHPEMAAIAARIAVNYRKTFGKDIIIDMITYRRHGHHEAEDPFCAQPLMYKEIKAHDSVIDLYTQHLVSEKAIDSVDVKNNIKASHDVHIASCYRNAPKYQVQPSHLLGKWRSMVIPLESTCKMDTGVDPSILRSIGIRAVTVAKDIVLNEKMQKLNIDTRMEQMKEGKKIGYASAEAMAIGSLLLEGHHARICGQDVARGVFIPRHAMINCQQTNTKYTPLNNLSSTQGKLELVDSPLGELAVMSYEYGMSLETPNRLNMWEAQLGDFFNSAQEVIDSFISGGEEKWLRQSGLVLVLPHGYEGAGPEHTSCRIERFLQLSSDRFNVTDPNVSNNVNWHVVNCSTPAQYFHVLRRQMKRNYRKPLIVVGPKRLTRILKAVSDLDDFAPGTSFQPVISDMEANRLSVRRVIFVSGKLYYELLEERAKKEMVDQVALIRVEEYSPFPKEDLEAEISKYPSASEFVWCQEETQNGGAWYFMESRLNQLLPSQHKLKYVGRSTCAAPANGIYVKHLTEQKQIYEEALTLSSAQHSLLPH
ncbi:putative 2-oxoglutarate dehydrogenase E1 component DHKTD1, mitochondrial-like protein [Basidiobolus meristosporus CBS 931.73]|uniref:Putative 2-oxoglutarate dehydrogenase E1 component DHKTD1, mitochondrial-like protein n=1 Tax=Basidiobolus meristosporus CBS 931.73 TaxID=1314790 RepID=A0A1Y1Y4X1_9FUNG|nr:putative 2-oxoglutarate dehydrogenase E1 component DHKTD1, mitochondrial-like protein [Basidiobolus meristosporus CBS 931.73]|eukprot:ORX92989.1 putative 2-oxoglutarate dehydrogenase E1 component DHKTD1, mitochondrial-like protein [Basidiobolus meristosporus CBS 931.73]